MEPPFTITFMGTGTGVPRKKRQATGLVVQAGDTRLMLDSGSGTAYQLSRAGFHTKSPSFAYLCCLIVILLDVRLPHSSGNREDRNPGSGKKVILTHLYPQSDQVDVVFQVKKQLSGDIIRAEDLMQISM